MNDKILFLLNMYKNDEEGFKDAYMSLQLSEEMANAMDKHILGSVIWLGKDDYLRRGLRQYKLKRILGE